MRAFKLGSERPIHPSPLAVQSNVSVILNKYDRSRNVIAWLLH